MQATYAVAKHKDFHEQICVIVNELAKISEKTTLNFILPYACASKITLSTLSFLSFNLFLIVVSSSNISLVFTFCINPFVTEEFHPYFNK